jgi:hypothetical protein
VDSLETLRELTRIRRRVPPVGLDIQVRLPGLPPEVTAEIRRTLRRHLGACGCHTGAVALTVAFPFVCVFVFVEAIDRGGLSPLDGFVAIGMLLGAVIVGKTIGIRRSARALLRTYRRALALSSATSGTTGPVHGVR